MNQPVTGFWLLAAGCLLLASGQEPVTRSQWPDDWKKKKETYP